MTYEQAKMIHAKIDAEVTRASNALNAFPQGMMGLTPDAVKFSPEFRAAKGAYDAAFKQLREVNTFISKHFKAEYRAERNARIRSLTSACV